MSDPHDTAAPWSIALVGEVDVGDLLPLLRAYCDFYEASPSDSALLAMGASLIAEPERHGEQLIARSQAGEAIGFATLFWTWDTLRACRIGVMNDLYVAPAQRGSGLGRALIGACAERCRAHGIAAMDWQTAPENHRAQRLYDTLGAEREQTIVYALQLASRPRPS